MDAELKAKWVQALRSGEYQQATGALYSNGSYCCIGVLGEIQGLNVKSRRVIDDPKTCTLPEGYNAGLDFDQRNGLAVLNDGAGKVGEEHFVAPKTFAQIADYIEANL